MQQRALLICGILAPLLYAIADLAAGLTAGGYSFRDQTISELGAIGAPSRALFSAILVPSYVLLLGFGIGVWRAGGALRRMRVAGGLLIVFSVMALLVGQLVPMRERGVEQGLTGTLHLVEGGVAMIMIVAAMGFAAAALRGRFRDYTIVTVVVMLVFGAWTSTQAPSVAAGLTTPWLGVVERVMWYAYQAWFAMLALTLLRRDATL